MAKLEKTICGLECCSTGGLCEEKCPYDKVGMMWNECVQALVSDALELLKSQEPVKPDMNVDTWICGKCGHTLEHQEMIGTNILIHEQYLYCPNCGREVKWK